MEMAEGPAAPPPEHSMPRALPASHFAGGRRMAAKAPRGAMEILRKSYDARSAVVKVRSPRSTARGSAKRHAWEALTLSKPPS